MDTATWAAGLDWRSVWAHARDWRATTTREEARLQAAVDRAQQLVDSQPGHRERIAGRDDEGELVIRREAAPRPGQPALTRALTAQREGREQREATRQALLARARELCASRIDGAAYLRDLESLLA